jgi:hypothetical protein
MLSLLFLLSALLFICCAPCAPFVFLVLCEHPCHIVYLPHPTSAHDIPPPLHPLLSSCCLCPCAVLLQVGSLHGELMASERGATLEAARNGAFRLLLVSDLAARGLDLPQVRWCNHMLCQRTPIFTALQSQAC